MIQRKQTIFFAITAVLLLAGLVLPVFQNGENNFIGLSKLGIVIPLITASMLALVSILMFRTRPKQLLFGKINQVVILLALGVIVFYEMSDSVFSFVYGIIAPAIGFFANLFGIQGVKSDEKLIRDMDRLR